MGYSFLATNFHLLSANYDLIAVGYWEGKSAVMGFFGNPNN